MFTEQEVRFLLGSHTVETAAGTRSISPVVNLAKLGCPERVFNRVLEDRARRLGSKFTEFRALQLAGTTDDLSNRIRSSKLF